MSSNFFNSVRFQISSFLPVFSSDTEESSTKVIILHKFLLNFFAVLLIMATILHYKASL